MKIIFDSEEEKDDFFGGLAIGNVTCPGDINLPILDCSNCCDCKGCWENAIPHEIKQPEA